MEERDPYNKKKLHLNEYIHIHPAVEGRGPEEGILLAASPSATPKFARANHTTDKG
jgi:hypothetical protein